VKLRWASEDRLDIPDTSALRAIHLVDPPRFDGLTFVMADSGPIAELSQTVSGEALLPTPRSQTVPPALGAELDIHGSSAGHVFGSFSRDPYCRAVTFGDRLSSFVVTSPTSVAELRAESPAVVKTLPLCWDGPGRPTHGEVLLDARWTPSPSWSLDVRHAILPRTLAILDPQGRFWGELACGSEADGDDEVWHIGPIHLKTPLPDLAEIKVGRADKRPAWRSSPEHARDPFAWMCWKGDSGPKKNLFGSTLGWLDRDPTASGSDAREYRTGMSLSKCWLCQNYTKTNPCEGRSDPAKLEMYGPADCDPKTSVLCTCP
jgi:hypothetical protein